MNCKKHKEYDDECADCIWGTDHQEVARKNQESEDLSAARFYFKLYHRVDINPEAVPELLRVVKKVQELLSCGEGTLRGEGRCNDLICELLLLIPANVIAKAESK